MTVPASVAPSIPMSETAPVAYRANVSPSRSRKIETPSRSRPAAAGFRTSGASKRNGPSPMKSVPLVTSMVSELEKSTVPMTVAKSPMANSASMVPKNSKVPFAISSVKTVPLRVMVGMTAGAGSVAGRVFTRTPTEPPMATPSVSTDARPDTMPTTASGVIRNAPEPPWMPWPPNVTNRLSTARTVWSSRPCWNRKSPPSATTPTDVASVAVAPSTSMRANGPPGRASVIPSTETSTAASEVLKAMRPVPASDRSSMFVANVPAAVPASPASSSTNVPEPSETLTSGAGSSSTESASDTSLASITRTSWPNEFCPVRMTRSALMSGPSRPMMTLSAVTCT